MQPGPGVICHGACANAEKNSFWASDWAEWVSRKRWRLSRSQGGRAESVCLVLLNPVPQNVGQGALFTLRVMKTPR